uniref:Piwi-like protein 1 n=1 Tax=Aceria tosichella TaxID=561515 RepID=A0A6G1SQC4_9ACAR
MAAPGRGRGESKNVQIIDEIDPRIERNRQAQLEAASIMGRPESEIPVRGRGGFRSSELRTIPENVITIRVENPNGSRQIDILANYVPIIPMPNRVVQMYRIDFEPSLESESQMRFLFRTAARDLFVKQPIYDGVHECRSGQKLPDKVTSVTIADPRDGQEFKVKFTNTGTSTYGSEFTRTYNMHMKDFLRTLGFYSPQVGLFVHPDHYDQVGPEIMMLRGFRTSANMHDGKKMLMNLEASHKLVQRQSVLTIMENIRAEQRGGNLQQLLLTALTGKIVVTSYNKRCYRIEEIDFSTKPTSTFDRGGKPMTYVDYYKTVHNRQINNLSQPMLKVVPNNQRRRDEESRVTLLVPELCNIAGLTEKQRNDNRLKMDLIRASQVSPNDRVKHLREFLQTFHGNQDIKEQLNNWGYSYGKEPCRLTAHVVAMTGYAFGPTCREPLTNYPRADINSANINVTALAVLPEIKKMVIIIARNQLREKGQLCNALKDGFDRVNLRINNVETKDITEGDSPNHYITAIRQLPADTSVAIVIMQSQHKERYDAIKKAASVEKGLITQVVTAKLMMDQRKARAAAQKIAIQVAAKVGGEPWWVDIPMKKTMICGYDTYHDTAKRGRSFGAFVASLNMRFSRWWSKADSHDRLDEISSQMSVNLTEALKVYKTFNNDELPERIIIYRDGVGEGQLEHVFKVELQKVKEALAGMKIKLTMIVVNKRIGARFYMKSQADGSFQNPPPGTVIDHTVTREERYDFYLISQSTRQGTVTPTYYNIIHDEAGFNPEIHQKMAFKMCLLYYNWSGTVRVPAPCQYAHKLALLCGEHLHSQPNAGMDDKLHYL